MYAFTAQGDVRKGTVGKRESGSARRMDWSVRDWARRVIGRSKKRGKRSGDEDGDSAGCGRESTTKRPPRLEQPGRNEAGR